jgi:transcription antitermination factor NusG
MSEDRPGTLEWYVVHTYSGYENKVKDNLEKAVENNGMQNLIQEVVVPTEEVVEIRNGKRVTSQHKTFPGYVLVRMIITNESWYVVRNTRGVTGFVGPGLPWARKCAFCPARWRISPAWWRKSTPCARNCA